jgi:hypothetical protein
MKETLRDLEDPEIVSKNIFIIIIRWGIRKIVVFFFIDTAGMSDFLKLTYLGYLVRNSP